MRAPFIQKGWWIVNKAGQQIVYDHTGKPIPCQVWSRVSCKPTELATATFQIVVNIAENEQEMKDKIAEWDKDNEPERPVPQPVKIEKTGWGLL